MKNLTIPSNLGDNAPVELIHSLANPTLNPSSQQPPPNIDFGIFNNSLFSSFEKPCKIKSHF
jgi:hypothetical protein